MQNRSRHILIPPHAEQIRSIFLFPSPAYKTDPGIFLFPSPRMQTEPEHVFDCPHVCDGCTIRTDAIRHERTGVRKTRWTMKMYSGSVPLRESNYPLLQLPLPEIQLSASPASPPRNPIIRFSSRAACSLLLPPCRLTDQIHARHNPK